MPIDISNVTLLEFSARYYYALHSSNGLNLTVLRDEAPPKITGGRGGWQIVNRRRRKGLTSWVGRDPLSMDLPVLFNGWYYPTPYSIDADKSTLMAMAYGDDFVDPPTVTIEGNIPSRGVTWVIQDLTWGDNSVWILDNSGKDILVRQDCVVSLLQYVQEDTVKVLNQATPKQESYKVKSGDTLRSIAQAKYGDASLWTLIRDANPDIRDPNNLAGTGKISPMPPNLSAQCQKDVNNFNIGKYSWLNFKRRWTLHKCNGPLPQPDLTIVIPPKK